MEKLKDYDFEMFSKKGNQECLKLVNKVYKTIEGTKRITVEDILKTIKEGLDKVVETHGEIYDTEPQQHIEYLVNKKLLEGGYVFRVSRWDF
jgi:hypothetical protein